jgi:hypothetical protein
MRISGATAFPNFSYAMTASNSGRMSFPVSPANYIYSQFKHVSGVPAPEGMQGVTVTKLKILDVMIEKLSQMKQRPELNTQDLSNEQIDALISKYEGQIKTAAAANTVMPYSPAPQISTGALFSISV